MTEQVGLPLGAADGAPQVPMARVAGWELELVGSHGARAGDFPEILKLVSEGAWGDVEAKLVSRRCSLSEGAAAIEDMERGSPLGITVVTDFEN